MSGIIDHGEGEFTLSWGSGGPATDADFDLIVPTNGTLVGSYGRGGDGLEPLQQPGACRAQILDLTCP